jgi:predicted nucleic-acid-binding protein
MKWESLDTNVLLRFTLCDITKQHQRAKKLIFGSKNTKFHVSDVAIVEYVYAMETHYKKSRREIAEIIEYIIGLDALEMNRKAIHCALADYVKHPKLSFADCHLAAEVGQNEAVPLWTFDKKLARQSGVAKEVP